MFYVYLLQSIKYGKLYIGFTKDLRRRVSEHNLGKGRSTRAYIPYKLIYYEAYRNENDAMLREEKLKDFGRAYGQLKRRIVNSLTS